MPLFDSHITTLGLQTETRSAFDSPATPLTAIAAWDDLVGGPTASGESVSERTALAISTVYTCVTTLSEAVASLPCLLMRRLDKGRAPAVDSYLYDLLRFEPNPEMTAFTFWQTMVGCSALTGNGYAQIMRDPDGSVSGLWPLNPLKTEPFRQADGTLAFRTTDGAHEGTYRIIPSRDILHFPLFSLSGIKGVSPVTAARETFALTKAAEKYGARWFGNGAEASSVFIFKGAKPDPKVQAELTESWQTKHGGANRHRQAFLFGDWDVRTLGLSPEDSQFLSTRNFQRAEIAAMFHLQPHQVGDTSRLSNANHVQAQLSFVTDTLRPMLVRIESELQRKLLPPPRTGSKLFVTFDVSERLRGDSQSQMTAYATGRQWGFLSINDCREGLGLNPIGDEGDVYLSPVNMSDAASLLQPASTEPVTSQPVVQDDPAPKKKKKSQRSLIDSLTAVHGAGFRDALGRAMHREKRDFETLSTVFTPTLTAIAASAEQAAAEQFDLADGWHEDRRRVTKDALKSLEKRASTWTDADEVSSTELGRILKSIVFDTYRAAGIATLQESQSHE